jgi:Zn-dependent peptidase ImmA (M78 family)
MNKMEANKALRNLKKRYPLSSKVMIELVLAPGGLRSHDGRELNGHISSNIEEKRATIYVNTHKSNLSPILALAHEYRHLMQHTGDVVSFTNAEDDANRFGNKFSLAYQGYPGKSYP